MEFKVIKKLYDPSDGEIKLPGEIIDIEEKNINAYGSRVEKVKKPKKVIK